MLHFIIVFFTAIFTLMLTPYGWGFEGFGVNSGGNDSPIYPVTSLEDSGEGSLRDALSKSNRHIVFEVDGEILLKSPIIVVDLQNITIDGATNKDQLGHLVVRGYGLYFSGVQNLIIQNIRIRGATKYGILLTNGTHNVVIDHCFIENSSAKDIQFGKNIDLNNAVHDITISYSIIGYYSATKDVLEEKYKGLLITDNNLGTVTNVSLHHNLFYQNYQRSPEISSPGFFVLINNIVYDWRTYGTRIRNGASGDLISNYYQTKFPSKVKDAVILTDNSGLFYLDDNFGVNTAILNQNKLVPAPIGSWPQIRYGLAAELLSWLPDVVGALPHDEEDKVIMERIAF